MAEQILPLTTLTVKGVTYTLQDKRVDTILEQLSGITNVIDDTTTGIETTWSSDKISTLISNFVSLSVVVVDSLPVSDIDTHTIYLLPKNPNDNNNVYTEYININETWEKIGDTEIDLTDYTTKVFVEANYAKKTDVYTKGEVDTLISNIPDENTEYLGDETTIHINGVTKVISALYTSNDFKNAVKNEQVQADWNQQNNVAKDYIKNKPDDLVRISDFESLLRRYIDGNYLRLIDNLDNFEAEVGTIVKYVGQTNAKYHNGWDYKKVGTQTVIPTGTKYINVQDISGRLAAMNVPNGIYYKVTDQDDTIAGKIRYHLFLKNENSTSSDCVPVTYINNVLTPIVGVYGCVNLVFSKITSYQVENSWYATLENGSTISRIGSSQEAFINSGLSVDIYENPNGKRIYTHRTYQGNDEYSCVLLLDYAESLDIYPVITPLNAFKYKVNVTQSPETISVNEWQQWNSQPNN